MFGMAVACTLSKALRLDNAMKIAQIVSTGSKTITTASYPLAFKVTPFLLAEPLKKKRRIDPAIIRAREEKRKKKIEKQIKRLQKFDRTLKPIEEIERPDWSFENLEARKRHVEISEQVLDERHKILKDWMKHQKNESLKDSQLIDQLLFSQQQALDELKLESEELYLAALQKDESLLPFKFSGPGETPPIEGYDSPDGDYTDISRKWEKKDAIFSPDSLARR